MSKLKRLARIDDNLVRVEIPTSVDEIQERTADYLLLAPGWYRVNCTTDLSAYEPKQIAKMVLQVNDKATNAFIQQVRRRINILERPLVTARGDGKSYIYANFNPKYAQYALTILRTFYNFCLPFRSWDKRKLTPAQRLGLTDKQFTIKDIIYFM